MNSIFEVNYSAAQTHSAISTTAYQTLMQRLQQAQLEHDVKILWAIESGSRAWGFHSPDSDYDCRFIYAHSKDWYLQVNVDDQRDVIEYPIVDDMDINGWDLKKALKLMAKSNPAVVEWLQSPIVYQQLGLYAQLAKQWLSQHYNLNKGIYHYRSSAKSNYLQFLTKDQVKLKKYFYVLRPLFAIVWIQNYQQIPPIDFNVLRKVVDNVPLQLAIDQLLLQKMQSSEMATAAPIPILQNWIKNQLEQLENFKESNGQADEDKWPSLNRMFLELI